MKLKEIAAAAAALMGEEKLVAYLDDTSSNPQTDENTLAAADKYARLCNLVISELAGSYIPMIARESVTVTGGKIYFTSLQKTALRIRAAYDSSDASLFFILHPEYMKVRGQAAIVEYEYMPDNVDLSEETGYNEKDITVGVLAYGVAAEVCLTEGRFEEAVLWRKRYSEGVMSRATPKAGVMKSRCFI